MSRLSYCAALAAVLVLAACSKSQAPAAADSGGDSAAPVQVEAVKREPIDRVVTAEAILYPTKQASIVPKITAPIARFLVQRGDHVREGQLLAVLENRDLLAAADESKQQYEQAQAAYQTTVSATMPEDLTKAQSDLESARQALDAANKVYESRQALLRQGAIAQKLVDDAKVSQVQAQSQFDTAQQHLRVLQGAGNTATLKSAQAQRDAAQAHYQNAEAQVSYAEVRSPLSGLISDRPLNVGEIAAAGSALINVVDISQVVARANVPVQEAAAIRVGRPATISGPGGELTGSVTVVSPAVDPNTTTVEVWVQAANPGEHLKPGSTVQISINAGQIPNAVVAPVAALLSSDDGGEQVMIAGSDGMAHAQPVKTGVRSGDDVQILDGLKGGEQVITTGALGLDDKAKIQIAKPGAADSDEEKGK